MGDDQKPQDEAGPEEIMRRAIPDEDKDVEGHRGRSLTPDAPAPDDLAGPDDADKPDSDEIARWSDRHIKVRIVPVAWD